MHVRVDHGTLDVVDVCVVLEGSLQQARLLTVPGDVRLIVVGEQLVPHHGIGNLGRGGGGSGRLPYSLILSTM